MYVCMYVCICKFFKDPKLHSPEILLEKFTRAYLFQIALESM